MKEWLHARDSRLLYLILEIRCHFRSSLRLEATVNSWVLECMSLQNIVSMFLKKCNIFLKYVFVWYERKNFIKKFYRFMYSSESDTNDEILKLKSWYEKNPYGKSIDQVFNLLWPYIKWTAIIFLWSWNIFYDIKKTLVE